MVAGLLLIIFTARRLDRWGTRALGLVSLTGADGEGGGVDDVRRTRLSEAGGGMGVWWQTWAWMAMVWVVRCSGL